MTQPSQVGHSIRREAEPTWCYHGRFGPRHVYSPGEHCPPGGPVVERDCPGCGAPRGYPPAGPYCMDHGTAKARVLGPAQVQEHGPGAE